MPCPAESVDFDTTQNIFIESDNLEALKILQKSYAGKIKMIYIDPPYNTGNDFIYHDDFSQSKKEYEIATGDRNINGELLKSFKKNSKDNGHYHSNWLNMMLPRLHLAHTLLSDDGVIFISIDDNEQAQLKLLCDEIFSDDNYEQLVWKKKGGAGNTEKVLGCLTEYILCYFKNKKAGVLNYRDIERNYRYKDNIGEYNLEGMEKTNSGGYARPTMLFDIVNPETGTIFKPSSGKRWTIGKERVEQLILENKLYFDESKNKVYYIKRADDYELSENVYLNLLLEHGSLSVAKDEISDLGIGRECFDTPKPTILIKHLLEIASNKNSIILDFFAGSATTAHAVMQLNSEDNGNRQFIMVQLPELTDEKSEAHKAGFKTISDISKERIRRAGAKIKAENPEKKIDTGFKVFKLSDSNFKAWQIDDDDIAKQLELYIDPLKDNANEMDIVYELLLKMGLKLTADIKFDNGVYWLTCENKSYAIALNSLSQDEFNAIIAKKPAKTVVLDKVFLNDSEKSNVLLQFKDAGLNFESI
ncbi:site-specific DNA-methyltransferase [Moraxella bovis]|nr:site-specific DNA-methyltransferase [Moraxella bovis]UZA25004.1 site-specific DNA-methyltransferase [Moraxella bovis]